MNLVYSAVGNCMRTFNIHEAKTHLSRLVDEAEKGEPFIIAKARKPKVKVIRIDASSDNSACRIGFMRGMYSLPGNYEQLDRQMDKAIEKLFRDEHS